MWGRNGKTRKTGMIRPGLSKYRGGFIKNVFMTKIDILIPYTFLFSKFCHLDVSPW